MSRCRLYFLHPQITDTFFPDRLIGEALKKNKGFLALRKLEAARDIATVLANSGNRIMLDAQSLLLNV